MQTRSVNQNSGSSMVFDAACQIKGIGTLQ
jgi:hypothetical protein